VTSSAKTTVQDVGIQGTDTDPAVRAAAALRRIHAGVLGSLEGGDAHPARRYLAAADEALYAPAAGAARTRSLVRALRAAAREAGGRADASALGVLFAIEEEVLVPELEELPGADLTTLVADLGTLLDGGELERPERIDVREIPHGQRHPRIFARYARLAPGETFVLVNNHDPKPLRREFEAAHGGEFSWEYLESGPEQWQVRIGRIAADA
jgi:uncharacterized protein (DUF2249 family)